MPITSEIIGYEDVSGTYCPPCWHTHKHAPDSITLILASIQHDLDQTIICDSCQNPIWE